jgi:hypothetical protein
MWGVYRDYYLHERIPKTPFSKQACVRFFFSMSFFHYTYSCHTCRLIESFPFALPFLLAFLAGKAVNAYHFYWAVLPGCAFFGMSCVFSILQACVANITHSYQFITQVLLVLLCRSGKQVSALSYTSRFVPTNHLAFEMYSCS